MEECADQEEVVQFDPNGKGTDNVTREPSSSAATQGGHIVLSMPLRRQAEVIGVMTLRVPAGHADQPAGRPTRLAVGGRPARPAALDRYQNDRWLITKAGISTREVAKAGIGPKHMLAKLIAVRSSAVILACGAHPPDVPRQRAVQFMTDEPQYAVGAV